MIRGREGIVNPCVGLLSPCAGARREVLHGIPGIVKADASLGDRIDPIDPIDRIDAGDSIVNTVNPVNRVMIWVRDRTLHEGVERPFVLVVPMRQTPDAKRRNWFGPAIP